MWKRDALWDEYVVALHNGSEWPTTVESATLTDFAGMVAAAGADPWVLEKQSRMLERQYRAGGEAFVRAAGPGALIVGAGAAAAVATTSAGAWTFVAPAVAGATFAALTVLPVYYGTVQIIDHYNKKRIMTEFTRRRLPLPLTLAPGETHTGSLFLSDDPEPGRVRAAWLDRIRPRNGIAPRLSEGSPRTGRTREDRGWEYATSQ